MRRRVAFVGADRLATGLWARSSSSLGPQAAPCRWRIARAASAHCAPRRAPCAQPQLDLDSASATPYLAPELMQAGARATATVDTNAFGECGLAG